MPFTSLRVAIVAAVAAATLTAAGCAGTPDESDGVRQITIAVGTGGTAAGSWDPYLNGGLATSHSQYIAQATMSPLFYFAFSGDRLLVPVLGESYEMAEDRESVDITLREGLEFNDGSPVDADAVVAAYEYYLSEGSQYAFGQTAHDAGVEFVAVDDLTVRFTFTEPIIHPGYNYWDIVRLLLQAPIISPSALADPEAANAAPMSVGPYVIEEQTPGVEVTLVRNPDYWDPESYPYDRIVLKEFDDSVAKLNALKSGQVDATQIDIGQLAEAEASGFRILVDSPTYQTIAFRDPDGGASVPLRDVRVRQAIAHAIDREAIAEAINFGYGVATSQIALEGSDFYVEGGDDRYPYDPEKARELMAEAGYADGFDIVMPGGGDPYDPAVQQALADIGIRVTWQPYTDTFGAFQAYTSPDFPMILYSNSNLNPIYLLDQEFVGVGRFFDPDEEIDRLLDRIKFGDAEESLAASQELGAKLLDEVWYVPVARPPHIWATTQENTVDTDDSLGAGTWLFNFHPAED